MLLMSLWKPRRHARGMQAAYANTRMHTCCSGSAFHSPSHASTMKVSWRVSVTQRTSGSGDTCCSLADRFLSYRRAWMAYCF